HEAGKHPFARNIGIGRDWKIVVLPSRILAEFSRSLLLARRAFSYCARIVGKLAPVRNRPGCPQRAQQYQSRQCCKEQAAQKHEGHRRKGTLCAPPDTYTTLLLFGAMRLKACPLCASVSQNTKPDWRQNSTPAVRPALTDGQVQITVTARLLRQGPGKN